MSDIVERLKDAEIATHALFDHIFQHAREEIERLRAKIAEMENQEPVAVVDYKRGSCVRFVEFLGWQKIANGAKLYALPVPPAPSVPDGFSREDLEAVADGLDGYEKTVNVGNVTGEGDDHLESTTAYAARFIRAMLAAPEAKP